MRIHLALVLFFSLASTACYEAIEHDAPVVDAGPRCASSDECLCNERCQLGDAGHVCTPYQPITCVDAHDCVSPLACTQSHRAGHGCGYLECQP